MPCVVTMVECCNPYLKLCSLPFKSHPYLESPCSGSTSVGCNLGWGNNIVKSLRWLKKYIDSFIFVVLFSLHPLHVVKLTSLTSFSLRSASLNHICLFTSRGLYYLSKSIEYLG